MIRPESIPHFPVCSHLAVHAVSAALAAPTGAGAHAVAPARHKQIDVERIQSDMAMCGSSSSNQQDRM